jgi:hypothetical protein
MAGSGRLLRYARRFLLNRRRSAICLNHLPGDLAMSSSGPRMLCTKFRSGQDRNQRRSGRDPERWGLPGSWVIVQLWRAGM